MFQNTVSVIKEEFGPQAALNDVAKIASYHRVQCSPGINEAAEYILSFLKEWGIHGEILPFPSHSGTRWWSQESFHQWECRDAELILLEDDKRERLCSFAAQKISLVQRSAPTPPEGLHTTMVYVEKATDPAAYEGLDVAGKIVFSRGVPSEMAAVAVDRFNAAGIATDTLREQPPVRDRFTLPDGRQYLSFWPSHPDKQKAFGFMLTPRQGENLRRRFAEGKKELAVFAKVDSSFYEGTMKIVTAVIPGEYDESSDCYEEVVAMAHLCHPQPSANDNASGCGTLMEVARTLSRLIRDGRLPRPKRTIRLLWLPEMTGSYAYLAENEKKIPKTVAAINLDMVGENQDLCKSTFIVEKPSVSLPGFGGDLAESMLRLMVSDIPNLGGTHAYSSFRWTLSPFSGGSDHYVWADPSVGVTCPMLIQWPDVFYHTSEDTIDKVDPKMLWVTGSITASYLYIAATATPAHAAHLAAEMAARFGGEVDSTLAPILDKARASLAGPDGSLALAKARRAIERRIPFMAERKVADIESLTALAPDTPQFAEARRKACAFVTGSVPFHKDRALANLAGLAKQEEATGSAQPGTSGGLPEPWDPQDDATLLARAEAAALVPERIFRGPFSGMAKELPEGFEDLAKAFSEKHKNLRPSATHLQYWADGKRTLLDIADMLEGETGYRDDVVLLEYVKLAAKQGVFRLRER